MKLPWLSVRARLAIWHAGVLTLIICMFSAGIFLFVGARLYADLDTQLAREIGTIARVYREEPEELKDLATHWGITLFQIEAGGSVRHQSEAWEREGLSRALLTSNSGSPPSCTALSSRMADASSSGSASTASMRDSSSTS